MKIGTKGLNRARPWRLKRWQTYVVAAVATGATLGLRLALEEPLGGRPTLVIFTLPIMLSAYLGGLGPGLLATLLSYLAASYFLVPPIYSFGVASPVERWQQFFVALAGVFISVVSEALHHARRRAVLVEGQRVEIQSHLGAIVESSDDAIIGKDLNSLITSWNPGAAKIFGYTAEEMLGTSITRLIPADRQDEENHILGKISRGESVEHFETVRQTKEGRLIDISVTISPIKDAAGRVIGASKVARDITERKRMEEAVKQADDSIRLVIDTIPAMAWTLRPDGSVDLVNQRWLEYSGLSLEQERAHPEGPIHPEDRERASEKWRAAFATGSPLEDEMRLRRADGEYHWFLVRTVPLRDPLGNIIRWCGASSDIEDRKKAEEAVRQADDRIRRIIDTIPTMVWSLGADGALDFVNQRWIDYTGISFQDAVPQPNGIVYPEDLSRVVEKWLADMAAGKPSEDEMRLRRADGEYRWFLVRTVPLRDGQGEIIKWYGTGNDIEDRKQAEMEVRTLIDAIPHQIWSGPAAGTLDYCNERWRSYMGFEQEDLAGHGWQSMLHPEDRERVLEAWQESVRNGTPYEQEERHRGADGRYRWFMARGVPMRDAKGRIVRWYGTNTDIEERKQSREALNAQALRYKTLMETSTDSIYVVDKNGDLQEANAAFRRRRGYTMAEMKGLNVADWDAQWDREQILERIRKLGDGGSMFETRHRCQDGSVFDVEVCATSVQINGDRLLFCVARDISERKRAEERLREYERVVEGLEEMIVVVDRDYRYLLANRAFLSYRGLEREQLIGRLVPDVLGPEAFAQVEDKLRECLAGKTIQYEISYRFSDDSERDLLISYFPIDGPRGIDRVACVLHNITERKQAEAALAVRGRQQAVTAEIGRLALMGGELQWLFDQTVTLVAETLGVEYCKVLELLPDGSAVKLTAGVGWNEGLVGQATVGVGRDSQAGYTLLTKDLVIVEDFGTETRFTGSPLLRDHGVVSGLSVIIGELEKPFGVLGAHTTRQRKFTEDDAHFFQSAANILAENIERKQAEDRLRRSEEKFKTLFDLAPVGISVLDRQHNVIDANPALEKIMRLRKEELLNGTHRRRAILNADGTPLSAAEFLSKGAMMENRPVSDVEAGITVENGEIIWVQVSVAPLALPDASAVVITQDITERKHAAKDLEDANYQLRVLSRQLFHIQEEERRHLARELHDEIGQTLTAARINLKIIAPDVPAHTVNRLDDSIQLLDRLLRQVRELSLNLRPPLLDELGLVPTLRWLVDQQAQRAGMRVAFSANVNGIEIDPELQTACFRVTQEAITNIIRHSNAKNIAVEVQSEPERLMLSVRDDGAGFDPGMIQKNIAQRSSLGLISMKERALLARGGLEIHSAPGQGTEIRAWFPLPPGGHPSKEPA